MNKIAISFALGASAFFATAATAAPLTVNQLAVHDSNVLNVRMICNENGRCWRERGERRIRATPTATTRPASATSSVAAMRNVAASASAFPA